MQAKIDRVSVARTRPREDLGEREEVRAAFRFEVRDKDQAQSRVPRFGPLPGEVFADEARFGSFN